MKQQNTIFEIPIYSMSEKEFNEILKQCKKTEIIFYPAEIWKYNQIIGYIEVNVKKEKIDIDIHCTLDKKICATSKTKHLIQKLQKKIDSFDITEMDNEAIKNEIKKWLDETIKEELNKRFYIDKNVFNNVIEYIDIRKMADEL